MLLMLRTLMPAIIKFRPGHCQQVTTGDNILTICCHSVLVTKSQDELLGELRTTFV